MNGRTVRRMLMARRARVFWGERAYLGVRLPLSLCGLQAMPAPFVEQRFEGDHLVVTVVSSLSSSGDPRTAERDERDRCFGGPYCVREPAYEHGSFSWIEAREIRYARAAWEAYMSGATGVPPLEELSSRPLLEEECAGYLAEAQARDAVFRVAGRLLVGAMTEARATDIVMDLGPSPVVVFAVKWFYKNRRLRFCAALGREVSALRRAGHDVRVLKTRFA